MGIEQTVQQMIDNLFAQLEVKYAHRPLILAILTDAQQQIDEALPGLITQGGNALIQALTNTIDGYFANLEKDVTAIPFLPEVLKGINGWIDEALANLEKQLFKEQLHYPSVGEGGVMDCRQEGNN